MHTSLLMCVFGNFEMFRRVVLNGVYLCDISRGAHIIRSHFKLALLDVNSMRFSFCCLYFHLLLKIF